MTHAGQPDALRWMLGHPVTGSCHALGVWPCVYQQHLTRTAARSQVQCLVGVNFPFLTSGPLFIFPGGTCLLGTAQVHLHHPQVTAEPSSAQPCSLLPTHQFRGEWAEAPAVVQVHGAGSQQGPCVPGAGRNRPPFGEPAGTCQRGLRPGCDTAPVLSVPAPG